MPQILMDPESKSLEERFALIKTPRRNRPRYPEACVTPVAGEQEARAGAAPARNLHPALVYGPSKSSEGQRIYYLDTLARLVVTARKTGCLRAQLIMFASRYR
ncbi:hypothetical protein [Candidatus Thiosymbion oneisti]|uniref:hypothetical protein n=1 Tax=Candidatus Thiosymbion oneisti TaxID=589554 RepID=UPI001FB147A2|nr:hypothetical protein [Candidatus Thiosymbion oneisti]